MPVTFATFLIGSLSLAGVFPLAGFWSKDEILKDASNENMIAYIAAMAVVFMTAYYMFRAISMTFLGDYRGGGLAAAHGDAGGASAHGAGAGHTGTNAAHGSGHDAGGDATGAHSTGHSAAAVAVSDDEPHGGHAGGHGGRPHESPLLMTLPLVVLAIPAILAGLVNAGGRFGYRLEKLVNGALPEFAVHEAAHGIDWGVAIGSSALAIFGVLGALLVYGFGARVQAPVGPLKPLYVLAANRFYIDEFYQKVLVRGVLYGGLTGLSRLLDTRLIDGAVNGVAGLARGAGTVLTRVQSGQQQAYSLVFVTGVVLVAAVMFVVAA
jgi:NADH:ubiquinone oxidoreductase subunit 5 (subunit L)/multisubunit Na+/H+ antiporter MnhA subunit